MFANSSELLSELTTIVQKNLSIDAPPWNLDFATIKKVIQNSKDSLSNNGLVQLSRPQLKKIEERIQKLEDQNDQLLCIIYYLFENISNLALNSRKNHSMEKEKTNARLHGCRKNIKKEDLSMDNLQRPELTKRETDVFNLLEKGLCAKEIAKILFISETTVITHKRNLKEKFNAKNTVELISKVLAK